MNYLAHLYLAQRSGTSAAGALLGDFVRGPLTGRFTPAVETGIRLHRRVDRYTDDHPEVVAARRLFAPPFRRYAGILVDLYFDHILACQWRQWHPRSLPAFAAASTVAVRAGWPAGAPVPAARFDDLASLLTGYREATGIQRALQHIDARLSRPSPLPLALPAVAALSAPLEAAFAAFFPELIQFALDQAAPHTGTN